MLSYTKEKGLFESNNKNWLHIDVTSDLHLESNIYNTKTKEPEIEIKNLVSKMMEESKTKELLIIAGDISNSNKLSLLFLKEVSNHWGHVLVIPGNHDLQDVNRDVERYAELLKKTKKICTNVFFLKDEIEIFTHSGIKFAGTFMSYNLHSMKNYIQWKSELTDKKGLTREFVNKRNIEDVDYYNSTINLVDVFISHIPIVNLHGNNVTENLFLNVDVNPFSEVLYISGHTHSRRNSITHESGFNALNVSYGYPYESEGKPILETVLIERKL